MKPIATLRSPTLCLKVEGSPLNFMPIWLQFTVRGDGSCAEIVIVSYRERWPCTEQTYSVRYRTLLFIASAASECNESARCNRVSRNQVWRVRPGSHPLSTIYRLAERKPMDLPRALGMRRACIPQTHRLRRREWKKERSAFTRKRTEISSEEQKCHPVQPSKTDRERTSSACFSEPRSVVARHRRLSRNGKQN